MHAVCRWAGWVSVMATSSISAQVTPAADPASRVTVQNKEWRATDQSCPAIPVDANLRQRMVNIAAAEWQRFGFQAIDHRPSKDDERKRVIVQPSGGDLVEKQYNPYNGEVTRRALRLGLMEDETQIRAAIGGYWSAVPNWDGYHEQSVIFDRSDGVAGWARPWSAAFISYVVCMSGLADPAQFQRSDGHRTYVDQAIAATDGQSPSAMFHARNIATGLPKPGDLLCADRAEGSPPYRAIEDRRPDMGHGRPMHCDLVVAAKPAAGYIAVIGGNVINSVSLTLVGVKIENGRQRVFTATDGAGSRPWFTILQLQVSGTASLNDSPVIKALGKTRAR